MDMTELKEKDSAGAVYEGPSAKDKPQTIHSIERALDIIEFLYHNGEEASIREISAQPGCLAVPFTGYFPRLS